MEVNIEIFRNSGTVATQALSEKQKEAKDKLFGKKDTKNTTQKKIPPKPGKTITAK